MKTITVHGVLAGAYRAGLSATYLTHASIDGGETAICRKVKAGNLCDVVEPGTPTCPTCVGKLARLS